MTGEEIVTCAAKECRHLPPWLAQAIDDAIAVGMGKEREACANTVHETLKFQSCMCCQRAMNAIRARRTP